MRAQNHPGRSIYKLFMIGFLLVNSLLPHISHANSYKIQELGKNFIPLDISDTGLILGKDAVTGAIITKRTNNTVVNDLGSGSEATQINDSNFVTGYTTATPGIATLWESGIASLELSRFTNLIKATAINGFNEIVGTRLDSTGSYRRPFHYDIFSGRLTTLGTLGGAEGWANDVNEVGYITGSSVDKSGNTRAFRYTSTVDTLAAVGTLGGYKHSEGWKISDDKSVIGWAYNNTANQAGKRAFYNTLSGNMANLGTLSKDTDSVARGINNHGQIVGQSIRADGNGQAYLFDTSSSDAMIVVVDPSNPTIVYAHSSKGSGIMKSLDKGLTWQIINNGLTSLNVNALLITPTVTNILYAATNNGIYKSTNGGNSWFFLSTDLDKTNINALIFDVTDTNRLYAGSDNGIYLSTNGGLNWTLANNSTGFGTYNFANDPKRPETLFAATNKGVYSSTDRGQFWSVQNGQGTTKLLSQTVSALVIDPNNGDMIYASTVGGGVFRADISAGSLQWKSINDSTLVNLNIYTLLFYNHNGVSTLFAGSTGGLYQRDIGSAGWSPASNFGDRGAYSLALGTDSSGTALLYASSFDGDIFRSESTTPPLASNWATITRGVSLADIYALTTIHKDANDPISQTHILAGANNGFFKLSYKTLGDSTSSIWSVPNSGGSGLKLMAISYDSRVAPCTLWAGSSDQGILISHDNGDTWSFSNEGLDNWNIYALTIDTTPVTPIVFAGTMGGVYRSDDGGKHWSSASAGLNSSPVYSLLLDTRVTPALLYAGTKQGVYRSSDYGRFWIPMNSGIENSEIVTLLRPQSGNLLAGSISGGLFISNDNGQSWQPNNGATVLPVFDLAEDPFMPGRLLAATTKGLYKLSCATSCTWDSTPLLAPADNKAIMSVRFDPDNANHIYVGTEANGVQVSIDLGNSWQALNSGITTVTNRMANLNNLLEPKTESAHWSLQDAVDINNNGEIIGWGYRDINGGGKYGYLLTPIIGTSTVDLVVTQSTEPGTVKQGIPFNYRITITNLGPDAETNAKLIDWLPPDITFRFASTSTSTRTTNPGFCEKRPENVVRCELGAIKPGETVYVNISMESPYRDVQIHNIARVKGNERDVDFTNNTTTSNNTVTVDKCFIATAAYGSFLDPHVTALRAFRDHYLLTNALGREFVAFYYRYSPPIANFISNSELLRALTRLALTPIVYAILYPLIAMALMIIGVLGLFYYRHHKKEHLLRQA